MTSSADEKRARALELRLAGATYSQIANAVGYANKGSAHAAVKQALEAGRDAEVPEVAETELARLDAMLSGLWAKARRGDVAAVAMVLKIQERRASILDGNDVTRAQTPPVDEIAARRKARRKPIKNGAARES